MNVHEIKILYTYYKHVVSGAKKFEIRKNDRNYQVGDRVIMNCIDVENQPKVYGTISYITDYNQKDNYVVFSMRDIEVK